jgi:hypothetical protein
MVARALAAVVLAGLALGVAAPPAGAQAAFNVDVPPGKVTTIRIRNLPEGAAVSVVVRLAGTIVVMVVNETQFRRLQKAVKPIFQAVARQRLSFTVQTPETGNYLVVLDNRRGQEVQAVEVAVSARRQRSTPAPTPAPRPTAPRPDEPKT